ncbi:hypothetical protein [Desulfogranum japonicum]|uniref:hypothetical protein n=1 Tax=Desulfogranum japonicum TaxID=231447 RepID=UPI0003F6EBE2|nr:hypothetical protein [Desulfogranum japonicum]
MPIKKLLDEISVLPGVTGSCIFDKVEGPLCTNSDVNIATDVLLQVGSYLIRMLKMGSMHGMEISGTHYRFDTCTVVGTPLGSGTILLTICDTKANCSLVATTAAMLAADMQEQLQKEALEPVVSEAPLKVQPPIETPEAPPPENDLQEHFLQIEEALAVAIGPVAGIVTQDYIVKWQEQGPAEASRLKELIAMLCDEISDPALAEQFTEQASATLL